eukprot:scaffold17565_cov69-Phaeocystis_antarctica.AAC.6
MHSRTPDGPSKVLPQTPHLPRPKTPPRTPPRRRAHRAPHPRARHGRAVARSGHGAGWRGAPRE